MLDAPSTRHPNPDEHEHQDPPRSGRSAPHTLVAVSDLAWRFLVCAAAIAVIAYALWQVRIVALPVFVSVLIATVLVPPERWLRARGLPPLAATSVVFLGAIAVLAGIGALIVPPIVDEFGDLGDRIRAGGDELGSIVASAPFELTESDVQDAFSDVLDRLGDSSGVISSGLLSGAVFVGELIAGLLLTMVLVFFFVKDGAGIWAWLVRQLPEHRRAVAGRAGARSWRILSAYVRGIAVVATVDAVLIALALVVIGVPLVIPLAALTFLGAFFPLIGAVLAGLAAALVALVSNGVVAAIAVIVVITLIQQLEGDLLYPLVVGRTVSLHPVAILLAVATGAVVAGIIGAFLAVPLVAVATAAIPIVRGRGGPEPGG